MTGPATWRRSTAPSHHAAFDLPLEMPFRIAYDTVTHARNVLVTTRDGDHTGFGEGAPAPAITGESQADVLTDLRGEPATRAGRCAVDTAAWDLEARRRDVPLCTLLSGVEPVPVATSITIPIVPDAEVEGLVARRQAEGFSIFKLKLGISVEKDIERLSHVRHLIDDAELRVDVNQAWSLAEAEAVLPEIADIGVDVLEQPLARADLAGHAALREASAEIGGPPVMLDESVFDASDAERALAAGAADWINIKLQKSGGITEALRIADLAERHDVPCMVGCMLESRVAILHGAHVVAAHPNIHKADLDGAFLLAGDHVQGGARYVDGTIPLDRGSGIGVTGVDGDVLHPDRPEVAQ